MTLKELRISKGYSQKECANIVGVPLRTFKRYETDKKYRNSIKYQYIVQRLNSSKGKTNKTNKENRSNIVIVGIGYVGLSYGVLLDEIANVTFVDINKKKVDQINKNISPINNKTFKACVKEAHFNATYDEEVYKTADFVIVAIPTNLCDNTNKLNTTELDNLLDNIRNKNKNCLIVIKSTLPVGYTASRKDKNLLFFPEFLREKTAINDVLNPTRLIFGSSNVSYKVKRFESLIEKSVHNNAKVNYMGESEAEAVKLFSNAYLAARIAFFNELDSFAYQNNLDSKKIIDGLGKDPRIGDQYNNPSYLFQGYCLPKDTIEIETSMGNIKNNQLISSIISSNNSRLEFIVTKIIEKAKKISHKTKDQIVVGIYDKDIINETPHYELSSTYRLIERLKEKKIKIAVYSSKNKSIDSFINKVDLIILNNSESKFDNCKDKVFNRSIY